jgi:hypothetical protein
MRSDTSLPWLSPVIEKTDRDDAGCHELKGSGVYAGVERGVAGRDYLSCA